MKSTIKILLVLSVLLHTIPVYAKYLGKYQLTKFEVRIKGEEREGIKECVNDCATVDLFRKGSKLQSIVTRNDEFELFFSGDRKQDCNLYYAFKEYSYDEFSKLNIDDLILDHQDRIETYLFDSGQKCYLSKKLLSRRTFTGKYKHSSFCRGYFNGTKRTYKIKLIDENNITMKFTQYDWWFPKRGPNDYREHIWYLEKI